MRVYVTTLVTKEILDQLNGDIEHVLMISGSTDKKPYALVSKEWLERRIGSAEILFPRDLVSYRTAKLADDAMSQADSKDTVKNNPKLYEHTNQIDLEDMIKDVEEKGK